MSKKQAQNWLILYDIRDGRRLRKVAKIVSSYGWRVQKSVFASDADEETIAKMKERLAKVIDQSEDFIVVIKSCEKCWHKNESYGIVYETPTQGQNYIILL